LRLDATQQIYDSSQKNIIAEIIEVARRADARRNIFVLAENEPQLAKIARPESKGGFDADAIWNDDFHHSAMVALTGRNEAYYTDYRGTPQEFISAAKRGFLYQGQWYVWQKQNRGTPAFDIQAEQFIVFLQNHDQIANSLRGQRLHQLASSGRCRALTALLLLGPNTPMLFQGQEFAAFAPFLYFADHEPDLAAKVVEGRRKFLSQFRSMASVEMDPFIANPASKETFACCKLDFAEREKNAGTYQLHRDLLRLRKHDSVFSKPRALDGAVLWSEAFLLRFFGADGDDRLLIINLGMDLHLSPAPEPLLAPPENAEWNLLWSSEEPIYGGSGTPPVNSENWEIPGHAALVFSSRNLNHG
jgi:maltooligosyltrehalose trehalohydrolase